MSPLSRLAARALRAPILAYQRFISPLLAPRCRYYPTCSNYAAESLRLYGPWRGGALAVWRLLRCNPFSDGGFDYPEDQRLFASRAEPRVASGSDHDCGKAHKVHLPKISSVR